MSNRFGYFEELKTQSGELLAQDIDNLEWEPFLVLPCMPNQSFDGSRTNHFFTGKFKGKRFKPTDDVR